MDLASRQSEELAESCLHRLFQEICRDSSPKLCAANLSSFINNLVEDLSNDVERARNEEYFLLNLRIEESSSKYR